MYIYVNIYVYIYLYTHACLCVDHCSFVHMGGHFPSHCVQGTAGSKFLPEIATALEQAMRQNGPDRVFVAFKGMHERTDSFAALPYTEVYAPSKISQKSLFVYSIYCMK